MSNDQDETRPVYRIFGKPLSEMSDDELKEKLAQLRIQRASVPSASRAKRAGSPGRGPTVDADAEEI